VIRPHPLYPPGKSIPLVPFPSVDSGQALYQRKGEEKERGANAPLRRLRKRFFTKGIKRGEAPFTNFLPSLLAKGRGIKGERLVDNDKEKEGSQKC